LPVKPAALVDEHVRLWLEELPQVHFVRRGAELARLCEQTYGTGTYTGHVVILLGELSEASVERPNLELDTDGLSMLHGTESRGPGTVEVGDKLLRHLHPGPATREWPYPLPDDGL
tara:strand:+ start:2246 stop:2593 length:348 start_codon:yes stop_codon:yes gene_type:complete